METTQNLESENADKLDPRSIYDLFQRNVEANRSNPIIIFHGRHVSYHVMLSMVDSLAESLRKKMEISKGDSIGIALPLSPQFLAVFLATQKIGAVAVPLDPGMTVFEFRNIMSIVRLKAIFVPDTLHFQPGNSDGLNYLVTTRLQDFLPFESSVLYTARNLGNAGRVKPEGFQIFRFTDLIYDARGDSVVTDPVKDRAIALISPSRSGELQAMYFTQHNVISSAEAISKSFTKLKGRFKIATTLPPFLPGSLQLSVVLTIFLGGTVTTVMGRDNYYRLFFLCSLFDCDYILTSPYDIGRILEEGLPNLAIRSMKGMLCSSYLLNPELRETIEKRYGTRIIEYYGIPEMLGITHFQSQDRSKEVSGSPGNTIPGVEARILEERTHEPVPEGTTGELFLRGPGLSTEFSPPVADPSEYYMDGFLDSGDLARMDETGIFIVEDRRREAIVSRGILISSREIEQIIAGVEGVSEVAVVGIGNNKGEEEIIAVVSAAQESPGLTGKILKACRTKLSSYKVPKKIEFRKELPKTMSGKVLKRQIIEEHTAHQ